MQPNITLKSKPPFYANKLENYYRFYIIAVTKGLLFFDHFNIQEKITPGHLLVLRKNSDFQLRTNQIGYQGLSIGLEDELEGHHSGDSYKFICDRNLNLIIELAQKELINPGFQSKEILDSLARLILSMCLRENQTNNLIKSDSKKSTYWSNLIIQAIEGALYTDKSIEQILEPFEPSYRQLSRYFFSEINLNPKAFQMKRKIKEACILIESKNLSLTAIAYELGFPSAQHFSTIFKKHMGVSPREYQIKKK